MKFWRFLPWLAVTLAMIGTALADQSNLSLPTTGTLPGLTMVNTINGAMKALDTCNSGSSAPTNTATGSPAAGKCWLDTSSTKYKLKIYDGSSWVIIAVLDTSTHLWEPVVGGGTATLASAATTDLGSASESFITVTGTTAITSFGSSAPAGSVKFVNLASAGLTITYNATSLIIPGAQSITTTATGTPIIAVSLGSGNWQVVSYQGSGGGQVLLKTITASGVTTLSDTTSFTSGYAHYRIVFTNLVVNYSGGNTAVNFSPQVSGTFQTTTSTAAVTAVGSTTGSFGGTGSNVIFPVTTFNSTAGAGINGEITVHNPAGTANYKSFLTNLNALDNSNNSVLVVGSLIYTGSQGAVTGFQIGNNGGRTFTGTVQVYGWN